MSFEVKDSGDRQEFASGMKRDTQDSKVLYSLVFDGPMLERYAEHLTKGAKKYDAHNWMKAASREEYERFRESAIRHFFQWLRGDREEDHAAATWFNINGAEYVLGRMAPPPIDPFTFLPVPCVGAAPHWPQPTVITYQVP